MIFTQLSFYTGSILVYKDTILSLAPKMQHVLDVFEKIYRYAFLQTLSFIEIGIQKTNSSNPPSTPFLAMFILDEIQQLEKLQTIDSSILHHLQLAIKCRLQTFGAILFDSKPKTLEDIRVLQSCAALFNDFEEVSSLVPEQYRSFVLSRKTWFRLVLFKLDALPSRFATTFRKVSSSLMSSTAIHAQDGNDSQDEGGSYDESDSSDESDAHDERDNHDKSDDDNSSNLRIEGYFSARILLKTLPGFAKILTTGSGLLSPLRPTEGMAERIFPLSSDHARIIDEAFEFLGLFKVGTEHWVSVVILFRETLRLSLRVVITTIPELDLPAKMQQGLPFINCRSKRRRRVLFGSIIIQAIEFFSLFFKELIYQSPPEMKSRGDMIAGLYDWWDNFEF